MSELRTDTKERNYRQEEIQEMLSRLIPEPMKWLEFKVDTWLYENDDISIRVMDKFYGNDICYLKTSDNAESIEYELINCLKNMSDHYEIFDAKNPLRGRQTNYRTTFEMYNSKLVNRLKFSFKEGCDKLVNSMETDGYMSPLWYNSEDEFINACKADYNIKHLYEDEDGIAKYFVHAICKNNFLQKIYSLK